MDRKKEIFVSGTYAAFSLGLCYVSYHTLNPFKWTVNNAIEAVAHFLVETSNLKKEEELEIPQDIDALVRQVNTVFRDPQ